MARVFHPVTFTSEVHVRYNINSKACENVIHYKWNNATPPTDTELTNLATEVATTLVPKMQLMMDNNCTFREVYARNIDTETAPEATYVFPAGTVGTRAGSPAPSGVAFTPIKRTGLTGKSHHGAIRFSGFDRGDVLRDTIQPFIVNTVLSIFATMLAQRVGGRFIPALASRHLGDSRTLRSMAFENVVVDQAMRRTEES